MITKIKTTITSIAQTASPQIETTNQSKPQPLGIPSIRDSFEPYQNSKDLREKVVQQGKEKIKLLQEELDRASKEPCDWDPFLKGVVWPYTIRSRGTNSVQRLHTSRSSIFRNGRPVPDPSR